MENGGLCYHALTTSIFGLCTTLPTVEQEAAAIKQVLILHDKLQVQLTTVRQDQVNYLFHVFGRSIFLASKKKKKIACTMSAAPRICIA